MAQPDPFAMVAAVVDRAEACITALIPRPSGIGSAVRDVMVVNVPPLFAAWHEIRATVDVLRNTPP